MAFPTNSIGAHLFLSLGGEIDALKERLEIVSRPGVAGLGLWKTGVRGMPYIVRAEVDCIDLDDARNRFVTYQALIGTALYPVTWNNLALTSEGWQAAVLDVTIAPAGIFKLAGSTPGLNSPSGAFLITDWEIVPVAV